LIERSFAERERAGSFGLEGLEFKTREVTRRCGALILEKLVALEDGAGLTGLSL